MSVTGALILGGGVLAMTAQAGAGLPSAPQRPPGATDGGAGELGWCWPMEVLVIGGATFKPTISDGVGSPRDGGARAHHGADVDYRRAKGTLPQFKPGTAQGSPGGLFFCPSGARCLAAKDGILWSVTPSPKGWQVVIDHGTPFATYYQHIRKPFFAERKGGKGGELVKAGTPLGEIGNDNSKAAAFNHCHFEVWKGGGAERWTDPAPFLAGARYVTL